MNTMLDDEYFEKLPDDPIVAGQQICKDVLRLRARYDSGSLASRDYDDYVVALSLFQALAEAYNLSFAFPYLGEDKVDNIGKIVDFFRMAEIRLAAGVAQISVERFRMKFAAKFGKIFSYEFSEGDLNR